MVDIRPDQSGRPVVSKGDLPEVAAPGPARPHQHDPGAMDDIFSSASFAHIPTAADLSAAVGM